MRNRWLSVALLSATLCHGQVSHGYALLFGNFSVPLSDFADRGSFFDDGFAQPGFGGGMEYGLALGGSGLSWATTAGVLVHPFDQEELEEEPLFRGWVQDLDGGLYISVPILTGVRFEAPVTRPLDIYVSAQLGANILNEADLEGGAFGVDGWIDTESDVTFAFCAGGGVVLRDVLNLGVRFVYMGEPELDVAVRVEGAGTVYRNQRKFAAGVLLVTVGVELR